MDRCPFPFQACLRSYLLRLLSARGAAEAFARSPKFKESGADQLLGVCDTKSSPAETIQCLQRMARDEMVVAPFSKAPLRFRRNLEKLGRVFNLDPDGQKILAFLLLADKDDRLDLAVKSIVHCSPSEISKAVGRATGLPAKTVRTCLAPGMPLSSTGGLFKYDYVCDGYWSGRKFFSSRLADRMVFGTLEASGRIPELGAPAPSSRLTIADWPNLGKVLPLAVAHLAASRRSGAKGVNILLHGLPGSGKTELARVLAREAGFRQAIDIPVFQDYGKAHGAAQLISGLEVIQAVHGRTGNVIIADEAEEVFTGPLESGGHFDSTPSRKIWLVRVLESNPAPTIWVLNNVENVDPAFLRRYDIVIHVESISAEQRQKHLLDLAGQTIGPETIRWMASQDKATPGVAARALAVVRGALDGDPVEARNEAFQTIVSGVLKAQGHEENTDGAYNALADAPDPRWINADYDLAGLPEALSRSPSARICLHGPPGTGKTCFGHWLANALGLPLIVRKASDLLSPYLGQTENKIMRAFREASFRKAVLMLDEVDSFLQDRHRAVRSWEVTQVNELLMQMERFQGIFIAATNLMENLDEAALRRFDLKIALRFLDSGQSLSLFERTCGRLGLGLPTEEDRRVIRSLANATPGDFANVARQHSFRPFPSPADLAFAVAKECKIKPGQTRAPLGFYCAS